MMSRFNNIWHELNNPVTAVLEDSNSNLTNS